MAGLRIADVILGLDPRISWVGDPRVEPEDDIAGYPRVKPEDDRGFGGQFQ